MRKFIVLLLLLSAYCVEVNAQYMTTRSIVVIKDKSRQKKVKEQANSDAEKEAFEEWKQQMQEKQAQLLNDNAAEEEARIAAEKEAVAKAKAEEEARIAAEKEAVAKAKAEKRAEIAAQKEIPAIKRKEKGYNQFVDLSYSYCSVTDFLGVNYIGGYRFNPYIFLGLGTGVNLSLATPDKSKLYLPFCRPTTLNVPIYIHFKANFTKSNWSPYASMSIGGRISQKVSQKVHQTENDDFYINYNQSGLFGDITLGVDRKVTEKLSLYLGIGYKMESFLYAKYKEDYIGFVYGNKLLHGFSLHLGLSF